MLFKREKKRKREFLKSYVCVLVELIHSLLFYAGIADGKIGTVANNLQ